MHISYMNDPNEETTLKRFLYGNNAAGCCLVIDWQKTFSNSTGITNSLYHVCYIHKNKNSYTIRKENNPQLSDIRQINVYLGKLKKLQKSLLRQNNSFFKHTTQAIPKLFITSDYHIQLKEIILGSKTPEISNRKIEKIAKRLGIESLSASEVSNNIVQTNSSDSTLSSTIIT